MKINKILLSLTAMLVSCMTLSISATAAEEKSTISTNSTYYNTISMPEMVDEIGFSKISQVGDTQVLEQTKEGTLYVEVIDSQEMVMFSTSTTYCALQKTYLFYYKNILGSRKDICKVNMVCDYEKANNAILITNLTGTYFSVESDVSVSWDDSYKSASNNKHTLGLSYDAGLLKTGVIKFTATLGTVTDVDISCDTSLSYDLI